MSEEYGAIINNINYHNISSIAQRQSELQEMRAIELYELVDCLLDPITELKRSEMTIPEILTYISEYISFDSGEIHKNALDVNRTRLLKIGQNLNDADKAVFADFLIEALKKSGFFVSESDFLPCSNSSESFVYVKNSLSDEAYDVFSVNFSDPRLRYVQSLKDVAGAVFDGESTYGLLPLEEGGGERLHLASELIYRYDLKINLVTPVFGLDGLADMKYALVSRRFNVPVIESGDDLYLEIRVSSDTSLSTLLSMADYFGASVYRIKSESFSFDGENESCFSLVLKKEVSDFSKILAYLTMFTKSCVFVGIYKNLE